MADEIETADESQIPADLKEVERWFVRRGIPFFIHEYNAREDIFTRALPILALVLVIRMVDAADLGWALWADTLLVLGAFAAILTAWALFNRKRNRRPFAKTKVSRIELAAFVLLPALVVLNFLSSGDAALNVLGGLGWLLVIYLVTSFGLVSLTRWAIDETFGSLLATLRLFTKALPLLLLFFMFLFINAEAWQTAGTVEPELLYAVFGLFGAMAMLFVLSSLPKELEKLTNFETADELVALCESSPLRPVDAASVDTSDIAPLSRLEWSNVGLVVLFNQLLQILLVSALIGAFFVVFGLLIIRPDTIAQWTGADPEFWWRSFSVLGHDIQLNLELLKVSGFLAAFAGMYFSVFAITDPTFRSEFYDNIVHEVREAVAVRAVYRARS